VSKSGLYIAHFTNTYFPVMSGVVRSISTFRQAQEELGHTVFIFGQEAQNYQDKEPFVFRYPSFNIPIRNYPATIPVSNHIDWVMPKLMLDVIHAHHPAPMGNAASDKCEKMNIPLVFTHHTRYQEYAQVMGLPEDLVKEIIELQLANYMQKCQHIVVPSNSIKQMVESVYGIRERVTVIPTGIDLEPYHNTNGRSVRKARNWTDDKKVIISVGRLAGEKNFETLIKDFAIVAKEHADTILAIIGDGPNQHELETLATSLGIGSQVDFVGRVPFEEMPNHLKAADLFSFASITETQGLVTMEAMAADLPVIAVDATGTSDIVEDGKDGILAENDPQKLAAGINRVLNDPDLATYLREGAIKKAKQFETLTVTQQLIDVYKQAIEDKKAGIYVQPDKRKPIYKVAWQSMADKAEKWLSKVEGGLGLSSQKSLP
jgi:1,2-diacylglycerol 3-alpha-glucosyltransferase